MGASVEHAAPTISILGNDHLLLDACFLRKGMVVPIEVGAEIKFIISNGDSFTIILAMSISFSTVSIIPSALAIEVGWGLECIYSSCLPSEVLEMVPQSVRIIQLKDCYDPGSHVFAFGRQKQFGIFETLLNGNKDLSTWVSRRHFQLVYLDEMVFEITNMSQNALLVNDSICGKGV